MPPPRRSALEVSFPDLAEELRAEEDLETLTLPERSTLGPPSVRKDSKRKKSDSLVDARVSHPPFCGEIRMLMEIRNLVCVVGTETSSFSPRQRKLWAYWW